MKKPLKKYGLIKKIKESRNRLGVAHKILGGLDTHISMTFGT